MCPMQILPQDRTDLSIAVFLGCVHIHYPVERHLSIYLQTEREKKNTERVRERQRERERERERDRDRETETERQRQRDKERHRYTERDAERHRETQRDRQTERQTDRETERFERCLLRLCVTLDYNSGNDSQKFTASNTNTRTKLYAKKAGGTQ